MALDSNTQGGNQVKFLAKDTQVLHQGRQVILHFPSVKDGEAFMRCLSALESGSMVSQATPQKTAPTPPESVWSVVLEAFKEW